MVKQIVVKKEIVRGGALLAGMQEAKLSAHKNRKQNKKQLHRSFQQMIRQSPFLSTDGKVDEFPADCCKVECRICVTN